MALFALLVLLSVACCAIAIYKQLTLRKQRLPNGVQPLPGPKGTPPILNSTIQCTYQTVRSSMDRSSSSDSGNTKLAEVLRMVKDIRTNLSSRDVRPQACLDNVGSDRN